MIKTAENQYREAATRLNEAAKEIEKMRGVTFAEVCYSLTY